MEKFSKAGYDTGSDGIIRPDGSLDLPQLMNILLDVFPEEQASAIADDVLAKYVEPAGEKQNKATETGPMVIETAATVPAAIMPAANGELYEENLAKYLATETSDVRDLINEARKLRMAMGKPVTLKVTVPPEHVLQEVPPAETPPAQAGPVQPTVSLVAPIAPKTEGPKAAETSPEMLEAEVRRFVMARKAYTSVDIMDFIRYLKDKGYHFQENIVLEDVYTRLEERKGREKAALMADISGFLERLPWPTENEVSAFIEQKKGAGIMCEGPEIKRMILVEMIRKH